MKTGQGVRPGTIPLVISVAIRPWFKLNLKKPGAYSFYVADANFDRIYLKTNNSARVAIIKIIRVFILLADFAFFAFNGLFFVFDKITFFFFWLVDRFLYTQYLSTENTHTHNLGICGVRVRIGL